MLRSVITYSFHHFCFLARTQKRLIRQCFVSLTLILLITFSSTQTQKCLTEGSVHSLTTYFSLYFFPTYTDKFQQMQCLFCTSVSLYVCVESSNFLSHFLKYSISLLQFCFSSQFFFYSTHTHTFISSLSSQLHTLTHTHKFHHQDM